MTPSHNEAEISGGNRSRRSFFNVAVALFGATALMVDHVDAQSTSTNPNQNDINVLNFALSLENLEAAFYNTFIGQFSSVDFANGAFAGTLGSQINGDVFAYFSIIRDHENQHVHTISSLITSLGGTPTPACSYNFSTVTSADAVVTTAMALENTGVMAYDGAINMIQSATVKQAAATVATVEARHAAFLNLLNGMSPFPAAFDTADTMSQITAIVTPFISSCPTS